MKGSSNYYSRKPSNEKPKKRKASKKDTEKAVKKIKHHKYVNDGRPPDTLNALLGKTKKHRKSKKSQRKEVELEKGNEYHILEMK